VARGRVDERSDEDHRLGDLGARRRRVGSGRRRLGRRESLCHDGQHVQRHDLGRRGRVAPLHAGRGVHDAVVLGPLQLGLARQRRHRRRWPSALALALGKDGNAYLLDRNNLGGVGKPIATAQAATGEIITAAAAYTTASATYVAFQAGGAMCTGGGGDLATLKIVPGSPPTLAPSWCASLDGSGSPIVTTSDGHADAIVWAVGAEGDNLLHGYDGDTGAVIFSGASTPIVGAHRFNAPIAAKGRIYAAGDHGVVAFTAQ
jgi:hypothetical protein